MDIGNYWQIIESNFVVTEMAHYLISPLFPLQRDQLRHQETLVSSLEQELERERQQGAKHQQREAQDGHLAKEGAALRDENARLAEELRRMKQRNTELEQVTCVLTVCKSAVYS